MSTDLGFDQEQLAAALERVEFAEDIVLEDIQNAQKDGSSQVGAFPQQGQAQFQLYPVLSYVNGTFTLCIVAVNNDDPETEPDFTVALKTKAGDVHTSRPETDSNGSTIQVIPLDNPAVLIGARLELAA